MQKFKVMFGSRIHLGIIRKIKGTGCNVLLIQKSIHRDEVMVIEDVERVEIEFITKTLNCLLVTSIGHFRAKKLGFAY